MLAPPPAPEQPAELAYLGSGEYLADLAAAGLHPARFAAFDAA